MAGGKETPRQKMIGMMYLVLTALLALQVSNAVLQKLAIIDSTLEALIKDGTAKSEATLKAIVEEAGKSQVPKVLAAKENAQKVRDLTKAIIDNIDKLKKEMMALSNTDKIDEALINDHSSKVAAMMIDKTSKAQKGVQYEKWLNDYVKQLSDVSGMKFETLAKAPKDIPMFASDKNHKNKDFLTFTFENTPVIAALASVTQTETEILEYEAKALNKLREDAGAGTIRFDQFVPMVRPKASVVAAGAKYEAEMFLSGSSTAILPEFYKDGAKLAEIVDEDTKVKMGKVEFTAQGGGYDAQGMAKKSFEAEIRMNDNVFKKRIEYTVIAPTIKVTTGNAPTLYQNCGNTVNIEVPALGTNYNPSFSGQGAEIIKGDKPGRVTIIPSQRKVTINVSNGGTPIGPVAFDVKPIPAPHYLIKDNTGKEVDKKNGVRGSALTGLRISAEAEDNFKQEVPKDANYRIRIMEVIHARGTAPINRMNASNENVDLAAWRAQFRPGDRIVIEVKTVTRRTYKGEEEKVDVKNEVYQIPIQ